MGIDMTAQKELIAQAISLGGKSKFNDIAVLEGQRELAARGLGKNAILGMIPSAANLGMALDMPLGDSVRQLDGAVFGFKKDISSVAAATKSARETADAQVKAAKISGMTPADIAAVYRFGAAPAHLSGVSESTLLAFGGIEKKANISGERAGTAFRALIAAAQAPTRGAKEALLANNLDYSKYQPQLTNIPVDPFVRNVAAQYGVTLNKAAVGALGKVFSSPDLLNDQSKFAPAVVGALKGNLNKNDLKSMKSIAGMANRFRNSIGGGADVNAFLSDLMLKLPGNIKLANAIFGSKQGGRIVTALGDPEVFKGLREQLTSHSEGFAQKIADARMAGFDGAVSKLAGSVKNAQTAVGRAFDKGGEGGALTSVTGQAAAWTQAFAEAPASLQRLAVEATAAGTAMAGLKGIEALAGGFGLKASAAALTGAAEALSAAAAKQALGTPATAAAQAAGAVPKVGKLLAGMGIIGTGIATATFGLEALNWYREANPELFRRQGRGVMGSPSGHYEMTPIRKGRMTDFARQWVPDAVRASFEPYQRGSWVQDAGRNKGYTRRFVPTTPLMAPTGYGAATGFGLGGFQGGDPMIRSITDRVDAVRPLMTSAGTGAMSAFASGLSGGAGAATAAMSGLMSNLAAIAAKGVDVPIRLDTSGAEARLNALMAKAGSIGGGNIPKPQFSGRFGDIGD